MIMKQPLYLRMEKQSVANSEKPAAAEKKTATSVPVTSENRASFFS